MAIKKVIEIDVNEQQAVGGLQNLGKAIDGVDSSAKGLNATFEEVYGDLQPLTTRMGEAEDRMYELALAGKTTSQEYKDLLNSVANYRKTQIEVDQTVDASATKLDEKLGGALQGVTSSFSAVQGVMALTGGQSEELEKAILKVQGAMALSEGVRGIREGAKSFKALGASAKTALSGIRTGIATTGIGALVIALGLVIAYWDDIKGAVNGVSSEQESLNKLSQTNLEAEQKKLDAIGEQDNILRLQGKSEKEILKTKISQTDAVIKKSEIQLENDIATAKSQLEASKRNKDILQGIIRFMTLPITLLLKTVDELTTAISKIPGIDIETNLEEGFSGGIAKLIFDPEETKKEGDAVVEAQEKALLKLKNDRAGLQLSIKNIDSQANKDAISKAKEKNDKEKELAKEKAEALERIRQGEIDTEAERREEELKVVRDQYKKLIEEAEKFNQDTNELKEAQRTKEQELKDKFKKEDDEKEEEYWKNESEKAQKRDEEARLKKEEEAKKEIEFQKNKDEAIASSKANFNNIIQGLEETGIAKTKAGQAVSKAIALTQIGIDSAVAISKASTLANAEGVATQLAFPLVPGVGTIARVISYASTALSVVSNISKAKKLLSSGGSGGVSTGGGGSAPSVGGGGGSAPQTSPTFNVVGNTGVNQIEQSLGSQQPIQAYVVANNVTTAQSLDRNIINNASLG